MDPKLNFNYGPYYILCTAQESFLYFGPHQFISTSIEELHGRISSFYFPISIENAWSLLAQLMKIYYCAINLCVL